MTAPDDRAAYIDGLRQLADVLEAHPEISLPVSSGTTRFGAMSFPCGSGPDAAQAMAAARRAFGSASWTKNVTNSDHGNWLNLAGQLAGLHVELYAARDAVCTRRVVGTEEREVDVQVTPAVTEKRTETVEIVEWDCEPILAPRTAGGAS